MRATKLSGFPAATTGALARRVVAAALAAAALAPCLAAAATGGEAGEGGAVSPFAGDVGTALWTLVIFVLVVLVLGRFAWGPVLQGLQGREQFIRESLEHAKAHREAAEARLAEYAAKLEAARAEVAGMIDEARHDAEALRRRIEEEAREEAQRICARAEREIGIAREAAVKELYETSAGLATQLAEKLLRRELAETDQQRLIAEAIRELEGLAGDSAR